MPTQPEHRIRPPRLAAWIARLTAPSAERDDLLIDLEDELNEQAFRAGRGAAHRWYWRQVFRSIGPLLRQRAARTPARDQPHRHGHPLSFLWHDARDSWRSLLRSPGFAVVVIVTLALGIGANTAIFTVLDALLFKRLPYADADGLVRVAEWPRSGGNFTVAPAAFFDWRARIRTLTGLEARTAATVGLLDGDAETLRIARVTSGYFDVLGVRPQFGRTFSAGDDRAGQPCAAVLSHRLWRRRFNADQSIIGRDVRMTTGSCTVIGVLPADSVFDRAAFELYLPLAMTEEQARSNGRTLTVFGRLARGASIEDVRAEMTSLAATFNAMRGDAGRGWTAAVTPLRDVVVRSDTRQLTWILFGAVGLVLLVACVNVVSLSLSRTIDRGHELAVRAALGAGRWRLFRYLLVESAMLASASGLLGVAIGSWMLRLFLWLVPPGVLPPEAISTLDGRALTFTAVLAVLTALVCGTLPAWQATTVRSSMTGAQNSRTVSGSRGAARFHGALLVTEIAMAMILVTAATLLVVSFTRLVSVDPGFQPDQVLTTQLSVQAENYATPAEVSDVYERLLAAIRRTPGVERASLVTSLPLDGWLFGTTFVVEGAAADPERPTSAHIQHVASDYFETLGIPLVAGRTFTPRDDARAPLVAIVNETFRRRFLGGPAVGRRVKLGIDTSTGASGATWEIAGVIGDVKTGGLSDRDLATPEIYVPHTQSPIWPLFLAFRMAPANVGPSPDIRSAVRSVEPDFPLGAIVSMDERIGGSVRTQRFRTIVMAAFAALAALLANLGVYAVRARSIRARRREIGVRVALGATRRQILSLLIGQSLRLVIVGLSIGLAGALLSIRIVQQWLFATNATDPRLLLSATVLLGGTALVAGWLPARQAVAADPLVSLRHE
jgi:putative ABC transport system permease protein